MIQLTLDNIPDEPDNWDDWFAWTLDPANNPQLRKAGGCRTSANAADAPFRPTPSTESTDSSTQSETDHTPSPSTAAPTSTPS